MKETVSTELKAEIQASSAVNAMKIAEMETKQKNTRRRHYLSKDGGKSVSGTN